MVPCGPDPSHPQVSLPVLPQSQLVARPYRDSRRVPRRQAPGVGRGGGAPKMLFKEIFQALVYRRLQKKQLNKTTE